MTKTYKKGMVFKNLRDEYEMYFIAIDDLIEYTHGLSLRFNNGKWKIQMSKESRENLYDRRRYQIVSYYINIDKILINGILKEIGERGNNET